MNNYQSWKSKWCTLVHFIRSRYFLKFKSREQLDEWQKKQVNRFLKNVLPKAPFYQAYTKSEFAELPLMDKSMMMADFSTRNTRDVSVEQAMSVAIQAEESRDFEPTIDELTVGLSSGTSGARGLFIVSSTERSQWAGILLAKTLPGKFIWHILQWWKPPLAIAFFLRANSNLYSTLNSRRIDFRFYDLLQGVDAQVKSLNENPPHALVAPATVLHRLAQLSLSGELQIKPLHIISVAEVLEQDDAMLIEKAFSQKPHQIYQATEGFLGHTCEQGNLHLNETHIHIEKDWLDKGRKIFQPIITDFSRSTQLIVRYRLDDVLRVSDHVCSCGSVETCIAAIEGRADQVLWLPAINSVDPAKASVALYPDILRRAMMLVTPALSEYSITQSGMKWQIDLLCEGGWEQVKQAVTETLTATCQGLQVQTPMFNFGHWQAPPLGVKRRRLYCQAK